MLDDFVFALLDNAASLKPSASTFQNVWGLASVNGVASSLAFVAGISKLAAPVQSLRALHELFRNRRLATTGLVRLYAAVEVAASIVLLLAAVRMIGAILIGVLGVCFASLGLVGAARKSRVSCGCLGHRSGRPLGAANVVAGFALMLVLPLNGSLEFRASSTENYSQAALLTAALASLALCLWIHRRVAIVLLLPTARQAKATPS